MSSNSGIHLRILPVTRIDFTKLQNSQVLTLLIAQHIETHTMTEADIAVRSHTGTDFGGGGTVTADLLQEGFAFDDPANSFVGSSVLSAAITLGAANTYALKGNGSISLGRHLCVQLKATQSAGGGNLIAVLSIDVYLKGGDPTALLSGPNSFRGYRIL